MRPFCSGQPARYRSPRTGTRYRAPSFSCPEQNSRKPFFPLGAVFISVRRPV
ncbi:MAG: hypothetical protein GY795_30725 [Desulfobacterales bacterium]|nr:hypothetical protein [Desulfobacterales bacterium]